MKLKFVGTGSGKTSLQRFHTSILLESGNNKVLIDAGDGISKALLSSGINYNDIDSILITHFHPDHVSGLPMLLNQMKMEGRERKLNIFVFEKQLSHLVRLCEINLIFPERLGFTAEFKPFIENELFVISQDLSVTPRANTHLEKHLSDEIKCFSIFIEPGNIHYTSDIGSIDDLTLFSEKSAGYVISECTHAAPAQILEKADINNLRKMFLVHIDNEPEVLEWHNSLDSSLKSKIIVCTDGFEFSIS